MQSFPDTSTMERGVKDNEPIRGGSMGLNKILGWFESASLSDHRPRYTAYLLSAYTIFRNVWSMDKTAKMPQLEAGFVTDVNKFVDYFSIYLSYVLPQSDRHKKALVMVYFPDYHRVPEKILRTKTGQNLELETLYKNFFFKHRDALEGEVRQTQYVRCVFVKAGGASYPHRDLSTKLRDATGMRDLLYVSGDPVALLSHIPLDLFLAERVRNVSLLESHTGALREKKDFGKKLDKSGVLPFNTTTFLTFGDDPMIKPMVQGKKRSALLTQAEEERWLIKGEGEIRSKIIKALDLKPSDFTGFDFT